MMLAGAEFRKVIFSHCWWSSWPQVLLAAICSCGSWEIHGNKIYQELLATERLPLIPEQHRPPVLKALLETSQKWLLWWAVLHLSVAGLSALQIDTVQAFLLAALTSRVRRDRSDCLGFVQLNYELPLVACRNSVQVGYSVVSWGEPNATSTSSTSTEGEAKSWWRNTIWKCWLMSELFFCFIETDLLPARKKSNHWNSNEVK